MAETALCDILCHETFDDDYSSYLPENNDGELSQALGDFNLHHTSDILVLNNGSPDQNSEYGMHEINICDDSPGNTVDASVNQSVFVDVPGNQSNTHYTPVSAAGCINKSGAQFANGIGVGKIQPVYIHPDYLQNDAHFNTKSSPDNVAQNAFDNTQMSFEYSSNKRVKLENNNSLHSPSGMSEFKNSLVLNLPCVKEESGEASGADAMAQPMASLLLSASNHAGTGVVASAGSGASAVGLRRAGLAKPLAEQNLLRLSIMNGTGSSQDGAGVQVARSLVVPGTNGGVVTSSSRPQVLQTVKYLIPVKIDPKISQVIPKLQFSGKQQSKHDTSRKFAQVPAVPLLQVPANSIGLKVNGSARSREQRLPAFQNSGLTPKLPIIKSEPTILGNKNSLSSRNGSRRLAGKKTPPAPSERLPQKTSGIGMKTPASNKPTPSVVDRKTKQALENRFVCKMCRQTFALNRILLCTGGIYMQGKPQYCINCWDHVQGTSTT